jgi:hypothetical protein
MELEIIVKTMGNKVYEICHGKRRFIGEKLQTDRPFFGDNARCQDSGGWYGFLFVFLRHGIRSFQIKIK